MQTEIRRLYIDTGARRDSSPYIFGHNLEHTRGCVFGALSAQLLRNRKFAGRPGARTGVSAEWFGVGEKAFFCNDRNPYVRHFKENGMWRRNETNAQTVQNPIEGQAAGIGQGSLFVKSGAKYLLAITAQCGQTVSLTAALTNRRGDREYARAQIELAGEGWKRYEAVLTPSQDDGEACLRLTFTQRASVVFGAISLLPEGHFHGMRPDAVEKLKELGVGMLRWPGGNFAGEYRWQDMLLPVDMRAPLQAFTEDETQPYSHGYDMHEIDTDSFIALCREIGAEPFITVNLAWDSAEECAAWVEYCNGAADSEYGKLRAQRGHAEPYGVKYWSLGNEMGYGHMEGPTQPEKYAALAKEAARAMLKVSPNLTLCSSGPYFQGKAEQWIEGSAKALLPEATFVSFHTYSDSTFDFARDEDVRATYRRMMENVEENARRLEAMRAVTPGNIHISYDEWNVWAAWFRKSNTMEGLYVAKTLSSMLYLCREMDAPIMCYFQPMGEGAVDVWPDRAELTADGQAFALMKAHLGAPICHIDGLAGHEAVASVREGALSVTLLNEDFDAAKVFRLNRCGAVESARALVAEDLLPASHFEEKTLTPSVEADAICVEVPPRSVALVILRLEA